MKFDFVYDGYASLNGTPDHLVPRLDPRNLLDAPHGLSGTEVNMLGLARELASRGHQIRIYSKWTLEWSEHWTSGEGTISYDEIGGVYYPGCNPEPDVVVAYHDGRPLDAWSSKVLKIGHHQSYGLSPTEDRRNLADLYWTPTERVSAYHRKLRGWDVHTIPNAWDYGTFCDWKPVPGRLIYHTSMERGFHRLVEAFPHIKRRVPEAHIVAFGRGGPDAFERMSQMMRSKFEPSDHRIFTHASRNLVLEILSTAACFAYPCDVPSPCEVWPMSVTDALATGVPVVLAPDDGIEAVFENGAQLVRTVKMGDWLEKFVDWTVEALTNKEVSQDWSRDGIEWAAPYRFKQQCDQFLAMVENRI